MELLLVSELSTVGVAVVSLPITGNVVVVVNVGGQVGVAVVLGPVEVFESWRCVGGMYPDGWGGTGVVVAVEGAEDFKDDPIPEVEVLVGAIVVEEVAMLSIGEELDESSSGVEFFWNVQIQFFCLLQIAEHDTLGASSCLTFTSGSGHSVSF